MAALVPLVEVVIMRVVKRCTSNDGNSGSHKQGEAKPPRTEQKSEES
jgi:hypothetical protein